eukprot:1185107-Prorocentrum_minimum.AAC.1
MSPGRTRVSPRRRYTLEERCRAIAGVTTTDASADSARSRDGLSAAAHQWRWSSRCPRTDWSVMRIYTRDS